LVSDAVELVVFVNDGVTDCDLVSDAVGVTVLVKEGLAV
jgi:hypothetical protein